MTDRTPERSSAFSGRLGFRMAALLAAALLPLGLISVVQSTVLIQEVRARSEAALMGETLHAASREISLIQRGQGVAESLTASYDALQKDPAACIAALKSVIEKSAGAFTHAGFIAPNGIMRCSSAGKTVDYSQSESFRALVANPQRRMRVIPDAKLSKQPVLSITYPAFTGRTLAGFVTLSIPQATLNIEPNNAASPWGTKPVSLMTFNADGHVMTATLGLNEVDGLLPRGRPLKSLASDKPVAFSSTSQNGTSRTFSVVPLIPQTLYAIGTWPAEEVRSFNNAFGVGPYIWPLLMCLASLIIAWMASDQLVTRYIRKLRSSITSFARGSRMVEDLDFSRAPTEIREVADAYEQMTESILHDEAELEDTIHQKEVLLREVHHRVKNNLQLIASMMNMQLRVARSPETKDIVKTLHDRVMSLATIHRGLYQTSGLIDVRADELLPDILRQLLTLASGPGRRFEVDSFFADIRLTPDQAVPLALLLTEALTNVMKYATAGPDGQSHLKVRLERTGGASAELSVANTADQSAGHPVSDDVVIGSGLGTPLMNAFAQQLGSDIRVSRDDGWYRLSIRFDVRPLADAEARHSKAEEPAA
jgi:two-component sensor histidine kinase